MYIKVKILIYYSESAKTIMGMINIKNYNIR